MENIDAASMNFRSARQRRVQAASTCAAIIYAFIFAYSAAGTIIDPSNQIDWTQSGIPGGIPNRTTISTTINASTYGNGTIDSTSAIQTALNSAASNSVVLLSTGTFLINSNLIIPSNVTLRGNGPRNTILSVHGNQTAPIQFGSGAYPQATPFFNITAGSTKGSTSITASSVTGISVGSHLFVTQLDDPSFVTNTGTEGQALWDDGIYNGTRCMGQVVEVTGIAGNVLTLAPPGLYYSYNMTPGFGIVPVGASYAGVENLQIYANNTGYTCNFFGQSACYCWILNCESNYTDGDHLRFHWCYRMEVRHNNFHDAYLHTSGQTDSDLFLAEKTSGCLIIDNICYRQHVSIICNWGAAGNVIAYNYCQGNFDAGSPNFLMYGFDTHGAHPMFNLVEGNIMTEIFADSTWGSASHQTFFRNWGKGTSAVYNPYSGRGPITGAPLYSFQCAAGIQICQLHVKYNVVGNLVGSQDQLTKCLSYGTYVLPCAARIIAPTPADYDGSTYNFKWGYGNASDNGTGAGDGPTAYNTSLEHGNYTFADGAVTWDPNVSDHNIPNSMFLSSKPSWFGQLAWPPFDPAMPRNATDTSIPAGYRFVNGTDPPSSPNPTPAAPGNLHIVQ